MLLPVKSNWIVLCDYQFQPCNCSSNWCKSEQKNWHMLHNDSVEHFLFLLPTSPKMMNGLQVCRVQIHLFSVDCFTVYHGSAKKQSLYFASCKFLMLLLQGFVFVLLNDAWFTPVCFEIFSFTFVILKLIGRSALVRSGIYFTWWKWAHAFPSGLHF